MKINYKLRIYNTFIYKTILKLNGYLFFGEEVKYTRMSTHVTEYAIPVK